MNAPKTVVVVMRSDGKLMPPNWGAFPDEERQRLAGIAHHLRCARHLSYKQAQRVMMEHYGERRSIGAIHRDVHDYECSYCSAEPSPAPAPPPAATPAPVQRPRRARAEVFSWR